MVSVSRCFSILHRDQCHQSPHWRRKAAKEKKPLTPKSISVGQGWISDSAKKRAIEKYAIGIATDFYTSEGWEVTELGKPYDLRCTRGEEELHVEVEGTTGLCASVTITYNEVIHAH